MTIKEIRIKKKLTQQEASELLGLSLRTYQNYELEVSKRDKFKIEYIKKTLSEYERITPNKGILSFDETKGLKYVGIYEELTNNMHKKIDLIRIDDLIMYFDFLNEVLEKGIKIYEGRKKMIII